MNVRTTVGAESKRGKGEREWVEWIVNVNEVRPDN